MNFHLPTANHQHAPKYKQGRSADLEDCLPPRFYPAERQHADGDQRAYSHADGFHPDLSLAGSWTGAKDTSFTQTVPLNLLSNFQLGMRLSVILSRCVWGPVTRSVCTRVHGFVPTTSGVTI